MHCQVSNCYLYILALLQNCYSKKKQHCSHQLCIETTKGMHLDQERGYPSGDDRQEGDREWGYSYPSRYETGRGGWLSSPSSLAFSSRSLVFSSLSSNIVRADFAWDLAEETLTFCSLRSYLSLWVGRTHPATVISCFYRPLPCYCHFCSLAGGSLEIRFYWPCR